MNELIDLAEFLKNGLSENCSHLTEKRQKRDVPCLQLAENCTTELPWCEFWAKGGEIEREKGK